MNGIKPEYQDKDLRCTDCGELFTWELNEQKFFADKGFPPPKRCPFCRQERRRRKKEDALRQVQDEPR